MFRIRGIGRTNVAHNVMKLISCGRSSFTPTFTQMTSGRFEHDLSMQPFISNLNRGTHRLWKRDFFTSLTLNKLHDRTCWKCGGDTNPHKELFFCECGVVQQPAKCATFFELLQIKRSFDIDTNVLSKRFKDTQRLLHPDKFSTKSKEEQKLAEEQSSLLNKSYETLLKPLGRSIYLLELEDVTISENDSLSDADFLLTMMEDFETISNATSVDDVVVLERNNDSRIGKCIEDLSKAFSNHDLVSAKNVSIQLRYFTTIQERIKEFRLKFFES